jgi:hypothetical protein
LKILYCRIIPKGEFINHTLINNDDYVEKNMIELHIHLRVLLDGQHVLAVHGRSTTAGAVAGHSTARRPPPADGEHVHQSALCAALFEQTSAQIENAAGY